MTTSPTATQPIKDLGSRIKARAKDWLDRPMTSAYLVLSIMILLLAVGLVMVLAASSARAVLLNKPGEGNPYSVVTRQLIWMTIGFGGFVVASRLPVSVIRRTSVALMSVSLLLLVVVLIPGIGRYLNGARSWIGVGQLSFQPSEIAKLALLLWSAHVFTARRSELGSIRQLLIPVLPVTAVMSLLIMLQPDLGTLVTLAVVLAAVFWFAGAPLWLFGSASAVGVGIIAVLVVISPYRLNRIKALLDPQSYPDQALQLLQGLYGMADGGLLGVGISGSRAKWLWLPLSDSDFIFAIVGETAGFVGAFFVIALFALLAYTGLRISQRNVDPYIRLVSAAATSWLVLQAGINIAYVVGIFPTTGLPLPLISAGGTSMVTTMFVFGLLMNFARRESAAANALYRPGRSWLSRFLGLGARSVDTTRSEKTSRRAAARQAKQDAKRAKRELSRSKSAKRRATRRQQVEAARSAQRLKAQMTARTPAGVTGPTRPVRGQQRPTRHVGPVTRPGPSSTTAPRRGQPATARPQPGQTGRAAPRRGQPVSGRSSRPRKSVGER